MPRKQATIKSDRKRLIYEALRRAILEKALKPGTRLPEDAIGERFSASRTIVRAALASLASEGLVELRRNIGAAVTELSWEESRDIWDVRVGLERMVVARLARGVSDEHVKMLKAHVDSEESARRSKEPAFIRLATEFHVLLAEMTGSPTLARYVNEVSSRCSLILAPHIPPNAADCGVDEHRTIISALASKDVTRAVKLMNSHLDAVAGRLLIDAPKREGADLQDILKVYASDPPAKRKVHSNK